MSIDFQSSPAWQAHLSFGSDKNYLQRKFNYLKFVSSMTSTNVFSIKRSYHQ